VLGIASNQSLSFPGIPGTGLPFLVMEEDYLSLAKYLGANVQGIVGYDLLKNFAVKIDFADNYISLIKPDSFKPPRKYEKVPIKLINHKPYMSTELVLTDGIEMSAMMMIDLGASHSILLNLRSDKRIVIPEDNLSTIIGRGLGGDINGHMARISSLEFSAFELNGVLASFTQEYRTVDTLGPPIHGSIGSEIMNRFTVYFDYSNEMMYLRKNYSFDRSFNFNQCGIEFTAEGLDLNKFVVVRVIENSPADRANIIEGDILVSLNGIPSEELTLNQINHIFRKDAGKRIWLKMERDGEVFKKKMKLERLI